MQDEDLDVLVRQRIRGLRQAREWSLDELAARTHVSPSTLSRIETGGRRITLDQLAPIAKALDTTIDELVDTSTDDDVVIRPQSGVARGWTVWPLTRQRGHNGLSVMKVRIEPGERPEPRVHPGRDWFYVVSGTVLLTLGDREILVHAGQAAEFPTMTPHALAAHHHPVELISIFDTDGRRAHLTHGPSVDARSTDR